jgi:hypothetical protein
MLCTSTTDGPGSRGRLGLSSGWFPILASRDVRERLSIALISCVLAGSSILPARADAIVFNTNTLSFTDDGTTVTSLDGTPLTAVNNSNGVASFYFGGNLNFGATDTITATGSNALVIESGNNVTIAPGATFNVSAQGSVSGAGGGAGGSGGGAAVGGLGGVGGIGGEQQPASAASQFLNSNGFAALPTLEGGATGPGPLSLVNFTLQATGLSAYTGGPVGVGTVIFGKGSFSTSPGTIPALIGAPNSGVLVSPSVAQGNITAEAQSFLSFFAGSSAVPAQAGQLGQAGQAGSSGVAGGQGVNAQAAPAFGGAGGQGGQAGGYGGSANGCEVSFGGIAACNLNGTNGQNASVFPPAGAGGGAPGSAGYAGGTGGNGGNGLIGATGSNNASGLVLSGGNGGGGGGSGGSGGGGGGGSGGGAGGFGGNNDPIFGLDPGQTGGTGGIGGGGGTGTYGATGGAGGGGGGAIKVVALGTLTSQGSFIADGAAGQAGAQETAPPNAGTVGAAGTPGGGCNFLVSIPGLGCINSATAQPGGAGAQGGSGGLGGQGGSGGQGGNGAGGTVELTGSVIDAAGSTIDASGGVATNSDGSLFGGGSAGNSGGRVVIASNAQVGTGPTVEGVGNLQPVGVYTDNYQANVIYNGTVSTITQAFTGPTQASVQQQANAFTTQLQANPLFTISATTQSVTLGAVGQGVVVNGQSEVLTGSGFSAVPTLQSTTGPQTRNPFIQGGIATPYIPNLTGGAAGFGLLAGVSATNSFFANVTVNAPKNAIAAIYRVQLGPTGYNEDFTGYDAVFLLNLTGTTLSDPALGIVEGAPDDAFLEALLSGGFATNPLFDGSGPTDLGMLASDGVYETLIPAGDAMFNFSADGVTDIGQNLDDGQFAYLDAPQRGTTVPEPSSLLVLLVASAGIAGVRVGRLRRSG